MVVWELLTGRRLFERATVSDTLAAVLTKEPDFEAVPVKVRRLLRVCVVKDTRPLADTQAEGLRHHMLPWVIAAVLTIVVIALAVVHFRGEPRWRRDEKQLFCIAGDGRLMAVDVKTAPKFEAGALKALFDTRIPSEVRGAPLFLHDVAADSKRFLINTVSAAPESWFSAPVTVVVNWTAGLKH